jgi:succinate dehydrogenase / fumarate reductase membrane anchor subunit
MTSAASLGLKAWLIQRVTAVYLAIFFPFAAIKLIWLTPHNYEQWIAWVAHPFVNAALALFILSLLLHAWIGLRDVVMDYVKSAALRAGLFTMLIIFLSGCGMWALRLLLKVAG